MLERYSLGIIDSVRPLNDSLYYLKEISSAMFTIWSVNTVWNARIVKNWKKYKDDVNELCEICKSLWESISLL